jgi:hypothetical protein
MPDNQNAITADMTVLDIVSRYRETEPVFRKYDAKAGECICCNALFVPLKKVAEDYGIDLHKLLRDLRNAISS